MYLGQYVLKLLKLMWHLWPNAIQGRKQVLLYAMKNRVRTYAGFIIVKLRAQILKLTYIFHYDLIGSVSPSI